MINHNGKEHYIYIYIYTHTHISESLCYTASINTTLQIGYTSVKLKKYINNSYAHLTNREFSMVCVSYKLISINSPIYSMSALGQTVDQGAKRQMNKTQSWDQWNAFQWELISQFLPETGASARAHGDKGTFLSFKNQIKRKRDGMQ